MFDAKMAIDNFVKKFKVIISITYFEMIQKWNLEICWGF